MIELKQRGKGLNYAFVLAILSLSSSLIAGFNGLKELSLILAGTTITSVAVAFLKGRNKEKNNQIQ
jgi:hypothetical protein